MIAQSFQYESPGTIQDAIALLQQHGDEAKILSGGHSLIPMMKLRLATPGVLVDINNIPGLSHITEDNGVLKIGGLTRESEVEHSDLLKKHFPIFGDVTKLIADPQVRNRGTLGGNLAHGDAATSWSTTDGAGDLSFSSIPRREIPLRCAQQFLNAGARWLPRSVVAT